LGKFTHVLQKNLHMFDPLSLHKMWKRLCKVFPKKKPQSVVTMALL